MPKVDNSILSKRDQIVSDVEKIIDPKNVLSHIDEIKPYETDALAAYKQFFHILTRLSLMKQTLLPLTNKCR